MLSDNCRVKFEELFVNPLFKIGFFDFLLKMQQEGIEAARQHWITHAEQNQMYPNLMETCEKMADFYIVLGFVPGIRHQQVVDENKSLKDENKFLKDTIRELHSNLIKEGGEKAQEIWHKSIDKQLEINQEITKNFFELFRMLKLEQQ